MVMYNGLWMKLQQHCFSINNPNTVFITYILMFRYLQSDSLSNYRFFSVLINNSCFSTSATVYKLKLKLYEI